MRNRWSASCGVSTPVGSSRIRMRAPRNSAFRISTRCCTPTGRLGDRRVEVDLEAVVALERRDLGARARGAVGEREAALGAEQQVLQHRERLDQHEVLVDHADAGADRVLRACGSGAPGRRPGWCRDRPDRSRRGCSSASTCRRRSRRRCRGSCRPGSRRSMCRLAWTGAEALVDADAARPPAAAPPAAAPLAGRRHAPRACDGSLRSVGLDLELAGDDLLPWPPRAWPPSRA